MVLSCQVELNHDMSDVLLSEENIGLFMSLLKRNVLYIFSSLYVLKTSCLSNK